MMNIIPPSTEPPMFSVEFNQFYKDKLYRCVCVVDDPFVIVSLLGSNRKAACQGRAPHSVARGLAHEILIEAESKQDL